MRIILTIICVLFSTTLFSSPKWGGREGAKEYLFVYNLRTQYRRLKVHFTEKSDTLTLHWTYTNDEGTRGGAFAMPKQSREHATQICYIMPTAGKTIVTPNSELFALLSRDAYIALKQTGKCRYNNTTLTLIGNEPLAFPSPSEKRGGGEAYLHVKDFDEGYEMWIEDNPDFPLILKMINNPIEIDWTVYEQ